MNLPQNIKHLEEMFIRKLVSKRAIGERIGLIENDFPTYDTTEYWKRYETYTPGKPERMQY